MAEENISQEFKLKKLNETINYSIEKIKQNELMSKNRKKVCATLNYNEYFFILASTITGCFSISAFASLIRILIGVISSAFRLKISAITIGIKKYKSIIKKKKKHDTLIGSNISHDKFVLIDNKKNRKKNMNMC